MKLETQALRPCGGCYDRLMPWAPSPYPLLVIAASILRAREDYAPRRGRNEKPDLYAAVTCTEVRSYLTLPRYRAAARDVSDPLERFRLASGLRPGGANSQSWTRLLLFL